MYWSKLTAIGLAGILSLAIALPVFAQNNENKDFLAIQDERDQRKQKDMLEAFLKNYPSSQHRPEFDLQLMTLYFGNKDWAQMVKHADDFAQSQGSADAKSKTNLFTLAMEAARQMGSANKVNDFADRALTADPNNISVLMTMSRNLAENPPNDPAGRAAAMEKAFGYAQRAQKVSKPEKVTDAEWQGTQGRLHGTLGLIYFTQNKWPEAGSEFAEFVKANPVDGLGQYRYGVALYNLLQTTLVNLQALNTEARAVQAKGDDVSVYVDRLNQRNQEFETQRDLTIDAMAKALAIGGPFATQARAIIEPLYKQKNNSLDGLDPFILAKKTELAALAPLPAPAVPQGRNGPAAGGGAGGGAGRGAGGGGGRPGR